MARRNRIERVGNEVVVKPERDWICGTIIFFVMAVNGIIALPSIIMDSKFTTVEIFGICFMIVWTGVTIFGVIFCLKCSTETIRISSRGVVYRNIFKSFEYRWAEIKDYGVFYYGSSKGIAVISDMLYFSTQELPMKNKRSKKLRGKPIKTIIMYESEYEEVLQILFPYCRKNTDVQPFIGDEYREE